MLIEIKPIEKKRWHGKTGKESFTRPKKIQALVDSETRTYATGLTDKEVKEYQQRLKVDLSNNFTSEAPHPFWDSNEAIVKLENNTMFLNTDHPLEFIKYKICKASKYVANSVKQFEEGLFPEATHVIYDEAEEVEARASKVLIKNKAIELASKLSKDQKINIILILNGKNLKGQSDDFVLVVMDDLLQNKPTEVIRFAEKEDKVFVANYALVIEALQKSVLIKEGHKILYHDSILGSSDIEVAEYFSKNENQSLKLSIMKNINS